MGCNDSILIIVGLQGITWGFNGSIVGVWREYKEYYGNVKGYKGYNGGKMDYHCWWWIPSRKPIVFHKKQHVTMSDR